jgi:hypothetical protein
VLEQAAVKRVRQSDSYVGLLRQWGLDWQGIQIAVRCGLVVQSYETRGLVN